AVHVARADPEQAVDPAQPPCILAAAEFALGVVYRIKPVALDAARVHAQRCAGFAKHRLDRIAPELLDDHRPGCHSGYDAVVSVSCNQGTSWERQMCNDGRSPGSSSRVATRRMT